MSLNKKRKSSHVVVRLPEDLRLSLERRQAENDAKSITPVVQEILLTRMISGRRPKVIRRNPVTCPTCDLFLRADLVQLIRTWAGEEGGTIGDIVFTLLAEDYEGQAAPRPAAKAPIPLGAAPAALEGQTL